MLNNNINPFCRLYRLIKHSRFKIGRSMLSLTEMYFHSAAYRHTGGPLLENELHHSPRSNDHRFAHHHRWIRDNPFPSCFYCLTTCLQDDNRLTSCAVGLCSIEVPANRECLELHCQSPSPAGKAPALPAMSGNGSPHFRRFLPGGDITLRSSLAHTPLLVEILHPAVLTILLNWPPTALPA